MAHIEEAYPAGTIAAAPDAALPGFEERLYDPEHERAVARRLRGIRWRRLMVTCGALALAAAGATGLTLVSRDAVQGAARTDVVATTTPAPAVTVPVLQVGPQPAASPNATPILSSASSAPVRLQPPPATDPNKLQERIATATPADRAPETLGAARAFAPQTDGAATPEGVRRIPLASGRPLVEAAAATDPQPVAATEPARPMPATAPLPPRRPNIAP